MFFKHTFDLIIFILLPWLDFFGLKFKNPVTLAAGVLGVTGLSLKRVAEAGAGAVERIVRPSPANLIGTHKKRLLKR